MSRIILNKKDLTPDQLAEATAKQLILEETERAHQDWVEHEGRLPYYDYEIDGADERAKSNALAQFTKWLGW